MTRYRFQAMILDSCYEPLHLVSTHSTFDGAFKTAQAFVGWLWDDKKDTPRGVRTDDGKYYVPELDYSMYDPDWVAWCDWEEKTGALLPFEDFKIIAEMKEEIARTGQYRRVRRASVDEQEYFVIVPVWSDANSRLMKRQRTAL